MSRANDSFSCAIDPLDWVVTYTVSPLDASDIDVVDDLMKSNSRTLGFLPKAALQEALDRRDVLGARYDGSLVGYLLYASYPERIRIVHLCVAAEYRGVGLAALMFEALKSVCTTQCVIRLNCRRDYDAHHLWPKLGFVPVHEKPGRSQDGKPLTCWEHRLRDDKQLDIFTESVSDQAQDVVIDAQILFHLDAPHSVESEPSKALLADHLADLVSLCLTDEILLEIDRQSDAGRRERSRILAGRFRSLPYNKDSEASHEATLSSLFQPRTPSDWSDVRHLAKTAASDVRLFVTRDDAILRRSKQVSELVGVEVLSPVDLILRLHRHRDRNFYTPSMVSGRELAWRRANVGDTDLLIEALRRPGEQKGRFREILHRHLARPDMFSVEILERGAQILGARASTIGAGVLTIELIRVARAPADELVGRFMIFDALAVCVHERIHAVRLRRDGLSEALADDAREMGFSTTTGFLERLCLSTPVSREGLARLAKRHFPSSHEAWAGLSAQEALVRCSPVSLKDAEERCFIVPIKPAYAMSLFDRQSASDDLFGGKSEILMRWENVYFRRKTHHRVLQAPARLLWYESGDVKAVTANSRLDSVDVGTAKSLYSKRRRYGTLDWAEISKMCDGDVNRKLMALGFSHTFSFRDPVGLDVLRRLEGRHRVPLQSPRLIPHSQLLEIMQQGYGEAEE